MEEKKKEEREYDKVRTMRRSEMRGGRRHEERGRRGEQEDEE